MLGFPSGYSMAHKNKVQSDRHRAHQGRDGYDQRQGLAPGNVVLLLIRYVLLEFVDVFKPFFRRLHQDGFSFFGFPEALVVAQVAQ
jgi:hypothetical protein